jgi:hypothetical protein
MRHNQDINKEGKGLILTDMVIKRRCYFLWRIRL